MQNVTHIHTLHAFVSLKYKTLYLFYLTIYMTIWCFMFSFSKFSHKNIVEFLGVSLEKNSILLVLEYMSGGDLKTYLKRLRLDVVSIHLFAITECSLQNYYIIWCLMKNVTCSNFGSLNYLIQNCVECKCLSCLMHLLSNSGCN